MYKLYLALNNSWGLRYHTTQTADQPLLSLLGANIWLEHFKCITFIFTSKKCETIYIYIYIYNFYIILKWRNWYYHRITMTRKSGKHPHVTYRALTLLGLINNRLIGLVGRVFTNSLGDLGSISGRVIPKTLKMVLDTSLLNTQQYKVRIKG